MNKELLTKLNAAVDISIYYPDSAKQYLRKVMPSWVRLYGTSLWKDLGVEEAEVDEYLSSSPDEQRARRLVASRIASELFKEDLAEPQERQKVPSKASVARQMPESYSPKQSYQTTISSHQLEDVLERLSMRADAGLEISDEQAQAVIKILGQKSQKQN